MKIMYCSHGLEYAGGTERVLTEKVNFLKKKYGYEIVIVLVEGKDKPLYFELDKDIKILNLDINYNELVDEKNKILRKLKHKLKKIRHKKLLINVVEEYKPDIIISTGDESRDICITPKIKCKKILESHFDKKTFCGKIREKSIYYFLDIYRRIKRKVFIGEYDKFVILTKEDKAEWAKEKKIKNIEVIPNPLPFYPKEISKCKNKTIISVGRLAEQKGYDDLIEVWNKLFKKYPDWKLEIYGEGPLRKELQEKIDTLGMTNSLLLKGNDKRIVERYLESSIYVLSSKYEGFAMVLVEAMASGLPVVSFDCPCGPKDIIKDGEDGFLIRNRDLDEMAKKLELLIKNENQRKIMGKKAHENIVRYSKEKVMLQWKNLFEELVNKKEK